LGIFERFYADLMVRSPDWMVIWFQVLLGVLALALLFSLFRIEARAIQLGVLMGFLMMIVIYGQFGFTRILSVGHVLFWTPTLFYMLSLQGTAGVAKTWFGRWLWPACAVMFVSLAFNYYQLANYLFGARGPIEMLG